jgi:hypothetical protein
MNTRPTRRILTAAALAATALMTSCAGFAVGGASGSSTTRSANNLVFNVEYPIRVSQGTDPNTADIYLTDLSDDELSAIFAQPRNWSGITGTLTHVHLFIAPEPGKTPIESTAASATIRTIVIAQGEIGVYDGAGFLLPGGSIEKGRVSARVRNAPLRLTRRTPGFADPLVTPEMDLSFSVRQDVQAASELDDRVEALSAAADPVRD